jgi:hypothetical protein
MSNVAQSPSPAAHHMLPNNPYAFYPMSYPPYGAFPPFYQHPPNSRYQPYNSNNRSHRNHHDSFEDVRSSSPPAEIMDISAEDFLHRAKLNAAWAGCLEDLGFSMSANLEQLTRGDWQAVGFKALEWLDVKRAFKKVRADLKSL